MADEEDDIGTEQVAAPEQEYETEQDVAASEQEAAAETARDEERIRAEDDEYQQDPQRRVDDEAIAGRKSAEAPDEDAIYSHPEDSTGGIPENVGHAETAADARSSPGNERPQPGGGNVAVDDFGRPGDDVLKWHHDGEGAMDPATFKERWDAANQEGQDPNVTFHKALASEQDDKVGMLHRGKQIYDHGRAHALVALEGYGQHGPDLDKAVAFANESMAYAPNPYAAHFTPTNDGVVANVTKLGTNENQTSKLSYDDFGNWLKGAHYDEVTKGDLPAMLKGSVGPSPTAEKDQPFGGLNPKTDFGPDAGYGYPNAKQQEPEEQPPAPEPPALGQQGARGDNAPTEQNAPASTERPSRLPRTPAGDAIWAAAQRHGVDPAVLTTIAKIESDFNPRATTGQYRGLFQMGRKEWATWGEGKDINDPVANADAAARMLSSHAAKFEDEHGRPPSPAELYMVHQQGAEGAKHHADNPDQPAWQNMYATGEGQQKGAAWSKKAIWGNMTPEWRRKFGNVENVTSQDFTDMWADRVAKIGGGGQQQQQRGQDRTSAPEPRARDDDQDNTTAAASPRTRQDPRGLTNDIIRAAQKYGVDPNTALRVAAAEGLRNPVGDHGTSHGAFQLHNGGPGSVGYNFKRDTGLDASDPRNERATIDYAMKTVAHGKGGWAPWMGASAAGVGQYEGIGGNGGGGGGRRQRTAQNDDDGADHYPTRDFPSNIRTEHDYDYDNNGGSIVPGDAGHEGTSFPEDAGPRTDRQAKQFGKRQRFLDAGGNPAYQTPVEPGRQTTRRDRDNVDRNKYNVGPPDATLQGGPPPATGRTPPATRQAPPPAANGDVGPTQEQGGPARPPPPPPPRYGSDEREMRRGWQDQSGELGQYGRDERDPDGWPTGVPRGGSFANTGGATRDFSEPVTIGRTGHVRSVGRAGSQPVYDAAAGGGNYTYDVDRNGMPLAQRNQPGFHGPLQGQKDWNGTNGEESQQTRAAPLNIRGSVNAGPPQGDDAAQQSQRDLPLASQGGQRAGYAQKLRDNAEKQSIARQRAGASVEAARERNKGSAYTADKRSEDSRYATDQRADTAADALEQKRETQDALATWRDSQIAHQRDIILQKEAGSQRANIAHMINGKLASGQQLTPEELEVAKGLNAEAAAGLKQRGNGANPIGGGGIPPPPGESGNRVSPSILPSPATKYKGNVPYTKGPDGLWYPQR